MLNKLQKCVQFHPYYYIGATNRCFLLLSAAISVIISSLQNSLPSSKILLCDAIWARKSFPIFVRRAMVAARSRRILFSRGVNKSCDDDREGDDINKGLLHTHGSTGRGGRECVFYERAESNRQLFNYGRAQSKFSHFQHSNFTVTIKLQEVELLFVLHAAKSWAPNLSGDKIIAADVEIKSSSLCLIVSEWISRERFVHALEWNKIPRSPPGQTLLFLFLHAK